MNVFFKTKIFKNYTYNLDYLDITHIISFLLSITLIFI